MRVQTLFFIALFVFSFNAHCIPGLYKKDECGTVDLRNDPYIGGKNPYQGSALWCSSYQAADLFSYQLKKKVSPLHLALSYVDAFEENKKYLSTSIGDDSKTIFRVIDLPFYGSKLCVSKDTQIPTEYSKDMRTLLDALENTLSYNNRRVLQAHEAEEETVCNLLNSEEVKKSPFTKLKELVMGFLAKPLSPKNVLLELTKESCSEFIHKPFSFKRKKAAKYLEVREAIKKNLDKTNPVGISVNSNVFFIGKISQAEKIKKDTILVHSSLIIGRKWNEEKKRCELLLKIYNSENCLEDYKLKCADGYVWMDDGMLFSTSQDAVWFE